MGKHPVAQRTELAEHQLAARVIGAASDAGARTILLVSARQGDGKTQLADCIARHAATITDARQSVVRWLPGDSPRLAAPRGDGVLWIDGLSLLDGRGGLGLTAELRASLDAVVLVARALRTPRADVRQCAEVLSALGLRSLGAVWNEDLRRPSRVSLLARLLQRRAAETRQPHTRVSAETP